MLLRWTLVYAAILHSVAAFSEIRQTMIVHNAPTATVNGRYTPSGTTDGGRACYEKEGPTSESTAAFDTNYFLCLNVRGYWVMQPGAKIGTNVAYMRSTVPHTLAPQTAGPWLMPDVDGAWIPTNIEVKPAGRAVEWSLSISAFGSLITVATVVWLALSHQPRIRDTCYNMISMAFCVFIGFFFTSAFQNVLFSGLSGTPNSTPFMKVAIGLLMFLLCYLILIVVSWKCQDSANRVAGIQYLGASITAFIGILVADPIQQEAVKAFPVELEGSGLDDFQAQALGAVIVTIGAWFFLALCRQASVGLRVDALSGRPSVPWAPRRINVKQFERSCMSNPAAGADSALMQSTWNWQAQLDWGEDTVAVLIESYLMNQTAFFLNTGKLPGLTGFYYDFGQGHSEFWITCVVIFLASFAIAMLLKERSKDSRLARTFQYSMAMATSWCLYRLLNFKSRAWCPDSHELQRICAAFVVTIACVLGIRALAAQRGSAPESSGNWNEYVFLLGLCAGNIIGLSWGNVFYVAVKYEAQYLLGPQAGHGHVVRTEFAISCAISVAVGVAWWKAILPRAMMRLTDHQALIGHEENILDPASSLISDLM